jgi:hypothetical protein
MRRQSEYYIEILFYSTRGLLRKNQVLEKYLLLVLSVAAAFRRLGSRLKQRAGKPLPPSSRHLRDAAWHGGQASESSERQHPYQRSSDV